MRYKVVAVDINGGKDQTSHEHNQAKRQAAQAIEGRLFGPQRQDQLILILENTTEILILQMGTEKHFQAASIQLSAYSSSPRRAAENDPN